MKLRASWDETRKTSKPSNNTKAPKAASILTLSIHGEDREEKDFIHSLYRQALKFISAKNDLPLVPIPLQESTASSQSKEAAFPPPYA